jgi:hypothetical protein
MSPKNEAILKLLKQMASARQAKPKNEMLRSYAASCGGFSIRAVEIGCQMLATEAIEEFKPRFPELARVIEVFRAAEQIASNEPVEIAWTIQDYKIARWVDLWLNERMKERGETLDQVLVVAPLWRKWKCDIDSGKMRCPGWCDNCEGSGMAVVNGKRQVWDCRYDKLSDRYSMPCPACREARRAS